MVLADRLRRGAAVLRRIPTRAKAVLPRVSLAVASVLLVLGLAEAYLRIWHPVSYREIAPRRSEQVWASILHRPSTVPGLAYELAPNQRRREANTLVVTNSLGMRDEEPLPLATAEPLRVAVVGDSFTFGFNVLAEETYPEVLEQRLCGRFPARPCEVLNFGVGGYSSRDEALVLRHKVPPFAPTIIIVGYYLNDPEIAPIQPLHVAFDRGRWWQHSHLLRLVAQREHQWALAHYGDGDYYRYLHRDPGKWNSVVTAFNDMREVATVLSAPVLVVLFPDCPHPWSAYPYRTEHRQVAAAARAAGLDVLDLLDAFSAHEPATVCSGPWDSHPSALGHRVAGEAIESHILENYEELLATTAEHEE